MNDTGAFRDPLLAVVGAVLLVVVLPAAVVLVLLTNAREANRRNEIIQTLGHCHVGPSVLVAQRPLRDADAVVAALRTVHYTSSHHSHPTRSFAVRITCGSSSVDVVLARDSDRTDEYWVFGRDQIGVSRLDPWAEIGRISTRLFDSIR
jgi:hypothetical protein